MTSHAPVPELTYAGDSVMQAMETPATSTLLCRVGDLLCALPLAHVREVMRPLPVEALAGVPACVRGLAVIRGAPVPVVDAAVLLSETASQPTRFITLNTGGRHVALAVDAVVGIRDVAATVFAELPPLVRAGVSDAIDVVGTLDAELLVILNVARVVPDSAWPAIEDGASA